MVGVSLAQHLNIFIRNLNEQGILDRNFNVLEMIRDQGGNPLYISQTISTYFHNAEESIERLTGLVSEPVINFAQVKDAAHRLKGCSTGIGGCSVVRACQELERVCDDNNKDRCLESVGRVKEKYCTLYQNLCRISAMPDAAEPPFRPREKLLEKQKHFQSIHKHTYLKGPIDKITSVAIPIALAASSLYLIGRGIYNLSHGIGKKE
ncbi:Histidine-containing phosphotransfer protein 1 [Morus notabilis]|uniref:Histidine-containing phosphotransfer protein 1 n=2 Tax=Morus notabilis TaxID=981085 RepID=W9R3F4_9ROSA|nr:Histidine-containing phosphotransfer protein 1 [Morus notabilis]